MSIPVSLMDEQIKNMKATLGILVHSSKKDLFVRTKRTSQFKTKFRSSIKEVLTSKRLAKRNIRRLSGVR